MGARAPKSHLAPLPADRRALLVAPLALEALIVRSAARGLSVRTSGLGPRRARAAARRLARQPGSALIVVGFCGALEPGDPPGRLIVASEVRDPSGVVIPCGALDQLLAVLERDGLSPRCGPLASVERLARAPERKRLRAQGAVAVDMESAWLAPAAAGRPFGVVRAVVDTPGRELARPWLTLTGSLSAIGSLRAAARSIAGMA
jgi:4-hydroxy-3-methylbut-2-enyl diphosphate reductase